MMQAESSSLTLFREHQQTLEWISELIALKQSSTTNETTLDNLRATFDKYLECSSLLNPYLEDLVTRLAAGALDSFNNEQFSTDLRTRHLLSALYAIAKVCGRKKVKLFLPHEVHDLGPVLESCKGMIEKLLSPEALERKMEEQDSLSPPLWESIYILWLWLDKLSFIPFSTKTSIDPTFVPEILHLGKLCLGEAGPVRETAAGCLASWLSRVDLEAIELPAFIDWSRLNLTCYQRGEPSCNVFLTMGIVQTLATILKVGQRTKELVNHMEPLWPTAIEIGDTCRNITLQKLLTKFIARLGCAYLPSRLAPWRYQQGRRSLPENLKTDCTSAIVQASGLSSSRHALFHVPDPVEDAMGHMIIALQDSSTIVRWSAAKGVGRITERLPAICADDVLDALLKLVEVREKDHAWHGACLAIAELARRGLLLPDRLKEVIPIVIQAIMYDVCRGQTSVGANVRDAACYTYWSFARAYSPEILRPYVADLSESIVVTSLFDREVNCRRAASAAFQECVGRQGNENFKHGIEILTTADYFTLGNRMDAYTKIAYQVAQYDEYRRPIIDHLHQVKLFHWDREIRQMSALSLRKLTPLDSDYVKDVVLNRLLSESTSKHLFTRHGAIIGLANIVLSLTSKNLPRSSQDSLAEFVPRIEKLRLYRGRGGEIVRGAVCTFIECICRARIQMSVKQQVRLLDTVDANIKHPTGEIQEFAALALHELMVGYFPVGEKGPSDRLQKRVVDKYIGIISQSDYAAETRGFTLALGVLPKKLLVPSRQVMNSVLSCLIAAASPDARVGKDRDAETRRNAILSLARIAETVLRDEESTKATFQSVNLSKGEAGMILDCFLHSLDDYNTDRRGDVGSWCRRASMKGLVGTIKLMVRENNLFDGRRSLRIVSLLLKQMVEKLDSLRQCAGNSLKELLVLDGFARHMPEGLEHLPDAFSIDKKMEFTKAEIAFPFVMKFSDIPLLFPAIFVGLITSVAGGIPNVTEAAEDALLNWLGGVDMSDERYQRLGDEIVSVFRRYFRQRRIVSSLLYTISFLQRRGSLDRCLVVCNNFVHEVYGYLLRLVKHSTDMKNLLLIVNVAVGLLSPLNDHSKNQVLLGFAVSFLSHPFPRVRKEAADDLYLALLQDPFMVTSSDDRLDKALALISAFDWTDDEIPATEVRSAAEKFATLLEVVMSVDKFPGTAVTKRTYPDFSTYASLAGM